MTAVLASAAIQAAADHPKTVDLPHLVIVNGDSLLGPVMEGDPVRHTICVANRGGSPLKIVRLRQWKGSRIIRADREIAPGAEGGIELELKTLNAGTRPLRGVTIVTNEKGTRTHRIPVVLRVTPQILAAPDRVDLSGLSGTRMKREIHIQGNLDQPLKLTAAESELPEAMVYDLQPSGKPGNYRLTVRCDGKSAEVIRGRFRFRTNYPQKPFLTVPVMARFLDTVQVVPKQVDFGTVVKKNYTARPDAGDPKKTESAKKDSPKTSVYVRLNRAGNIVIKKAAAEIFSEAFPAEIHTVENGRIYRIDITAMVKQLPAGALTTELLIYSGRADSSVIRIPLRIVVQ